jgi:hypothetical protein
MQPQSIADLLSDPSAVPTFAKYVPVVAKAVTAGIRLLALDLALASAPIVAHRRENWEMPTVDPEHLADLLWTMHDTKGQREAI